MKTEILASGLLCALCAARVHANVHAYMQTQIELTRPEDTHGLTEEDMTRVDVSSLLPEEYRNELLSLSQLIEGLDSGRSPHCSGRITTVLQRCTKDRLTTEDRDEAAMLLTLCDRGRAYALPMECEGLGAETHETDKLIMRRCAMALDQHQNFQRTFDVYRILVIPEKCKSLNAIFNVDPSREAYKNITIEVIRILQSMSRKDAKTEAYFSQWDDRLNTMQFATADLSATKRSLMEYNENFVNNLNGMMMMMNATMGNLFSEALSRSEEVSSELRNGMSKIEEDHVASLALALSSFESAISDGLTAALKTSQERQDALDSAAVLTISQLMDAVNDLSEARQDLQDLGIFVRELMSKAYNQAFLLDIKQHEVSESLSGLNAEIKELVNTTHRLNASLTDIREEAMDHFSSNQQSRDTLLLGPVSVLRNILHWMGLSPLYALSLLLLSLPRVIITQAVNLSLWLLAILVSFVMKAVLGHRRPSKVYDPDPERNMPWTSGGLSRPLDDPCSHCQVTLPRIAYLASKKESSYPGPTPLNFQMHSHDMSNILGNWGCTITPDGELIPSLGPAPDSEA